MPTTTTSEPQPDLTPAEGGRYLRDPQTGALHRQAPDEVPPSATDLLE